MKFKHGFTLAELLTAVLVISIIMVALAPVITKRMKDNVSVTTDNKKGLEVYTNPGTYTFDVPIGINTLFIQGSGGGGGGAGASVSDPRTVTFTSNTTWKVPTGVNQITFEITGAGGGGGGANGRLNSGNLDTIKTLPKTACLSDEYLIPRVTDDGRDACITLNNMAHHPSFYDSIDIVDHATNPEQSCTHNRCCWLYYNNGIPRHACTHYAASDICNYYKTVEFNEATRKPIGAGTYRLPTVSELNRIAKYNNSSPSFLKNLNFCDGANAITNIIPTCVPNSGWLIPCNGMEESNKCAIWRMNASDGYLSLHGTGGYSMEYAIYLTAASTRCIRPLDITSPYSASGGASGAVLEKTINVLPNDTFEITIGQGGAGGASKTKGSQGETTKIVHKRKNIELGTYYVKGGLGGNPATTSAHGSAYLNNTTSSGTTPSGTCYSRNRKDTSDSFTGGNTSCTTISYSGESGSSTKGGNGGRVKNTGTINNGEASSGGFLYQSPLCNEEKSVALGPYTTSSCNQEYRIYPQRNTTKEANYAKGQNASTPGFGGGGGLTPAWANSTSHFYQGGKGANGKVEITYKVALPGGGGGSSARVAGVDNNNKAYEIIYKVSEGDRIVFKVGSGGSGGIENQDGLNGSATVVGDNDIVFLAGEGGKTATDTDKNNLKGGRGGYTSYINEEDNIQSNIQTGIKLKSKTPPITYTINPPNNSFKGQNGTRGGVPEADTIQSGYTITNTIFTYGFNGGMGASPFNVEKSKTAASISCGGGIQGTLGQTTNLKYLCTSGNTKGNDARNHDPVNNEFGGSGGGGGGVKDDSFEQGTGGNGSSGYLRIRWDASEQE